LLMNVRLKIRSLKYSFDQRYRSIKQSGLFDTDYYYEQNKDIEPGSVDPIIHYLEYGFSEGRNPHPLFNTLWYLRQNYDAEKNGINPLYHFIMHGRERCLNPSPLFETGYYLKQMEGRIADGVNPLKHYLDTGAETGARPNPLFDTEYYLLNNQDVLKSGLDPFIHYAQIGCRQGRATHRGDVEMFSFNPRISIVTPVYNGEEGHLRACIESILGQSYDNWEMCLADDASSNPKIRAILNEYRQKDNRIKTVFLSTNQGIAEATNSAVLLATGDFVGFLDHDDELTHDALLEVVRAVNVNEGADLLYSDECFIDEAGNFKGAHFKPDFSPDLLLNHNYITHFLVIKKELLEKAGSLSSTLDGAQDYDLVLRTTELASRIVHIPQTLYRWRMHSASTASDPESKSYADKAGKRALEDALERRDIAGKVYFGDRRFYYRVKRDIKINPLVSIIIPFCDQPDYLRTCVESILEKTSWSKYEIIGISNNSSKDDTFALMDELAKKDKRVKFVVYDFPFNYSKINNFGVEQAEGEHIVLMNNDVEIIHNDWLETLLEHSQRPEVGAVGAKLYYPDDTIQHAGVILGISGFAGHSHRYSPRGASGYFNRLNCVQNMSAVTAALLMVEKTVFLEAGGLDEENFAISLNDVDFCLKLRQKGLLNIFTPYCEALHYESVSRGYEDTPEKKERFKKERVYFMEKWSQILEEGDPYYNPHLSLEREDFRINSFHTWYSSDESRKYHLGRAIS